jgi:integrase
MPQRKDGRFYTIVDTGKEGREKYHYVYGKTQKDADAKADELKLQYKKGMNVKAQRDTWGQWAEKWLETKKLCSRGQYQNYSIGKKHFDSLNDKKIVDIRSSDIKQIINELSCENPFTHRPSAKRTLNFAKSVAIQIFAEAIDDRVIDYNPALSVKVPSDTPQEKRRALTEEEQGWVINTPHRAQRAAMIMMYSGLRRGELIPLTWNDIDLHNRTIRVNKSVELINGKPELKAGAKSEAGARTVNIPQKLVDFLSQEPKDNLLVCPSEKGVMMSDSSWKALWKSYMKELNNRYGKIKKAGHSKFAHASPRTIPPITAHWLRHTFATLLYLSGVDVLTAKEQLGHADVKTTLQIYTHLDKLYKDKNIAKLDLYLSNQNVSRNN